MISSAFLLEIAPVEAINLLMRTLAIGPSSYRKISYDGRCLLSDRVKTCSARLAGFAAVRLAVILDDEADIISDAEALCAERAEQAADAVEISQHGLARLMRRVRLEGADETEGRAEGALVS